MREFGRRWVCEEISRAPEHRDRSPRRSSRSGCKCRLRAAGCGRRGRPNRARMQLAASCISLAARVRRRGGRWRSPGQAAGGDEVGFEVVEEGARGARARASTAIEPLTGGVRGAPLGPAPLASRARAPAARGDSAVWPSSADLEDYLGALRGPRRRRAAATAASRPPCAAFIRAGVRRLTARASELLPERFEPAYRELLDRPRVERAQRAGACSRCCAVSAASRRRSRSTRARCWRRSSASRCCRRIRAGCARARAARRPCVALLPPLTAVGASRDGARAAAATLQTAMRLYAPGIALAPLAWIRGRAGRLASAAGPGRRTLQTAGDRTRGRRRSRSCGRSPRSSRAAARSRASWRGRSSASSWAASATAR